MANRYTEPEAYFPESILKEFKLGKYAEKKKTETKNKPAPKKKK